MYLYAPSSISISIRISSEGFVLHVFEVVRAAHVGHPSVVVVAEVRAVAGALVKQVVRSFLRSKISGELPGDQGAVSSLVPLVEGLAAAVVVPPAAQHLLVDGVEVVGVVLVGVVVAVLAPEAVRGVAGPRLCLSDCFSSADILLDVVQAGELGHVVDDLVVEV